jgi:hypothetical protein
MSTNIFWLLGESGILLELGGALYIARNSVAAHRRVRRLFSGLNGLKELPKLVEAVQKQTRTDITGFLLLASGLLLQFLGGLQWL